MSLRPSVVAAVLAAFVVQLPVTARADDAWKVSETATDARPLTVIAPSVPDVLTLRPAARPTMSTLPTSTLFARAPEDIRLSHGAKVAIIVTAIVVGSLIVLGLVVYGTRPGHL